jgi:hypothetical protein
MDPVGGDRGDRGELGRTIGQLVCRTLALEMRSGFYFRKPSSIEAAGFIRYRRPTTPIFGEGATVGGPALRLKLVPAKV